MSKTAFKEKGKGENREQYYRKDDGKWIKTGESFINSLWHDWVIAKDTHRYRDKEDFLVFDYK